MTGPEESHGSSRPISVAELLAKNGTIGAPPVGGRRRRRRGNTDSVTVAELTGEIPIVAAHSDEPETRRQSTDLDEPVDVNGSVATNGTVHRDDDVETDEAEAAEHVVDVEPEAEPELFVDEEDEEDEEDDSEDIDDDYADAVADYAAHLEQRNADPDLDFFEPPRRSHYSPRRFQPSAGSDAEQMSPDPLDDEEDLLGSSVDVAEVPEIEDLDTEAALDTEDRDPLPSYLRSTDGPLFGGQTVADDVARRGVQPAPEGIDLEDLEVEADADTAPRSRISAFLRGALVVGQCVIAVAFGAGLFIAFDQLWKWNNIVALVLSVLVILGLVVGVRVVRKTEDIGSTLIAVAVGALVTLGPLALLQSG
jgi:hypothetical protein